MLSLKCDNFYGHLAESLQTLRQNDELTDVTLTCDVRNDARKNVVGFKKFRQFKAHKLLLSIASPYFKEMFIDNPSPNPIIMLRHTYADELEAILDFVYNGEAQIKEEGLDEFLNAAKYLQIYGYLSTEQIEGLTVGRKRTAKKSKSAKSTLASGSNQRNAQKKLDSDFEDTELVDLDSDNEEYLEEEDDHEFEKPKRRRKSVVRKKKAELDEPGNFECEHCKLIFWSATSLRNHLEIHEAGTGCSICSKVFSHPALLNEHIKSQHFSGEQACPGQVGDETEEQQNDVKEISLEAVIRELQIPGSSPSAAASFEVVGEHNQESPRKVSGEINSGNPEPLITGREKPLSPEEAFAILSGDEAAHDGETLKPFKARGGEVYLFNINNKDTIQNHLKLDGYKWKNKSTINLSKKMSKTYFYARTPVGTLKEFCKHQFVLEDESRVLIHYIGDETQYKDFYRGISTKKKKTKKALQKSSPIKIISQSPLRFRIDPIVSRTSSPIKHESQNEVTVYSYKDIVYNAKMNIEKK